jgi:hypothetical protein
MWEICSLKKGVRSGLEASNHSTNISYTGNCSPTGIAISNERFIKITWKENTNVARKNPDTRGVPQLFNKFTFTNIVRI